MCYNPNDKILKLQELYIRNKILFVIVFRVGNVVS